MQICISTFLVLVVAVFFGTSGLAEKIEGGSTVGGGGRLGPSADWTGTKLLDVEHI